MVHVLLIHLVKLFALTVLEVALFRIHWAKCKRGPDNALETLWGGSCVPRNREEGLQSIRWGRPFARVGVSPVSRFRPRGLGSNYMPNFSINSDAGDKAARAGYVRR